jgi:hypothetical protein
LEIVGHITAGRGNEAIQKLLEPMPVVIGLDIHFADDKTRIASENETFEKLKDFIIQAVKGAEIKREGTNESPRGTEPPVEADRGAGTENPGEAPNGPAAR